MTSPDRPPAGRPGAESPRNVEDQRGVDDLDGLIGGLEMEAARRRADPHFPIDDDARLSSAFDAVAPSGDPSGQALAAAVVAAAPQPGGDDQAPSPPPGRRWGRPLRPFPLVDAALREVRLQVRGVALATADAVHVAMKRLDALDRRVDTLERTTVPAAPGEPSAARPLTFSAELAAWHPQICAELAASAGRVLYSGPDADAAVPALVQAGVEAYGITTTGDQFRADVDVRFADLLGHLGSVGTVTLGTVVVAGEVEAVSAARLSALIIELARTTASVMVVSPSPWWWRQQLGTWASDVAVDRPLSADTWLEALSAAGFVGRGQFDELGHSYRVVATRR